MEVKKEMKHVEKGIEYAKATLAMEGLYISKEVEELYRQYGNGEISREEIKEKLRGM